MKKLRKRITSALTAAVIGATSAVAGLSTASITVNAADENYVEALQMSLYFYDSNHCGGDVGENPLTWRDDCHMQDATASLDNAQGLSSSSKSAIMAQNGGLSTVDVSGGYHDAGDHVKFSMTMGFSISSLAWSYFSYPEAYETAQCTDHLLYILKNACDYFMKVTYLDGNDDVIAFCYQVASEGEDHSQWTAPETQTFTRTTYWADSSHPSGDASGQMAAALAASSLAFRNNGNTAYADECLKYAQALQEFTKKYPAATYDGVGSMYASGQTVDDVAWAEVWCQLAANDGKLPSSYTPSYVLTGNKEYTGGNYDGYLYCWDKVWSGYAALLAEVGYNTNTYVNEMKTELSGQGGLSSSSYNAAGWGASRYNCALQMLAHHIAEATGDNSYVEAAKFQMDTILGNNSTGYSFLLGYGDKWATRVHHRAANPGTGNPEDNTEATYTAYGALVGGMDSSGNYTDHQNSYQFTEPALDYNGCFALAIAPLVVEYGGDASTFPAKIASIAEIKDNYVFDSDTPIQTTTSTTETTTATTTSTTESTTATTEKTTESTEKTTASTKETTDTSATTTEEPVKTTESSTTQEPDGDPVGNAWLAGQAGSYSFWNMADAGQVPTTITGNGQYTVAFDITSGDGTGSIECLILSTDISAYDYAPAGTTDPLKDCGINIAIDSIKMDGTEVAYSGPTDGAFRLNDDGTTLRVNIYNTWTNPAISDIANQDITLADKLEVTFTVSGLPGASVETTVSTESTTTATTTTTAKPTETTKTTTSTTTDKPVVTTIQTFEGQYLQMAGLNASMDSKYLEPGASGADAVYIGLSAYNMSELITTMRGKYKLSDALAEVVTPYLVGEGVDAFIECADFLYGAGATWYINPDELIFAVSSQSLCEAIFPDGELIFGGVYEVADKATVEAAAAKHGIEATQEADGTWVYKFPIYLDTSYKNWEWVTEDEKNKYPSEISLVETSYIYILADEPAETTTSTTGTTTSTTTKTTTVTTSTTKEEPKPTGQYLEMAGLNAAMDSKYLEPGASGSDAVYIGLSAYNMSELITTMRGKYKLSDALAEVVTPYLVGEGVDAFIECADFLYGAGATWYINPDELIFAVSSQSLCEAIFPDGELIFGGVYEVADKATVDAAAAKYGITAQQDADGTWFYAFPIYLDTSYANWEWVTEDEKNKYPSEISLVETSYIYILADEPDVTTTSTTTTTTTTETTTTTTTTTSTTKTTTTTTKTTTSTTKTTTTTTNTTATTTKTTTSTTKTTTTGEPVWNDLIGDVNLDKKVGIQDVIRLNKYIAKQVTLNEQALRNAECKSDGTIDTNDIISLMRYLVDLVESLPEA